jgi:hypothetical protein
MIATFGFGCSRLTRIALSRHVRPHRSAVGQPHALARPEDDEPDDQRNG